MRIVIVGASFAGLSAALECRLLYPEAEIVMIDKEEEVGYFPNALNWMLKGQITSWTEAKSQLYHQVVKEEMEWMLGWEMVDFLPENKTILVDREKENQKLTYDYLILAMGAGQVWEKQSGDLRAKILASKSLRQIIGSQKKLEDACSVTVVGAGQIGLESLDALSNQNLQLRLIEAQKWPLAKYFDQEMVEWIWDELKQRQIEYHFSETVNQIELDEAGDLVLSTLEQSYCSDYMVLGTNFRPETSLVGKKLPLESDGTILVDAYLQTLYRDVFAIGDLIQVPIAFFGQSYLPMINHAVLTGRLVAHNLLEKKRKLEQVERIVSSHVFGRNLTSVGLTEKEASLWLDTDSIRIQQPYSQWQDEQIDFKLIVSQEDGRLLGGQLVSTSDHTGQMNMLALAISQQLTVQDLLQQSWLCLPDRTAIVPFLYEAANQYDLQNQERR